MNYKKIFESYLLERRMPRQTKRQRASNTVKAQATKELSGDKSPVKGAVKKIFMEFKKKVRQKGKELKTPITGVNTSKITIRDKS